MRFLDANVFVYAYYRPRKSLGGVERRLKDQAKAIIRGLNEGKEEMVTTVVHLSEVSNVLKHGMRPEELHDVISGLLMLDNLKVLGVSDKQYLAATELGLELGLDPNDALAVQVMRDKGLTEIYTFDRKFEGIDGVTRLPPIPKD